MDKTEKLRLAIVQMTSVDDWNENIEWCSREIIGFAKSEIDVFCFPENALFMRLDRQKKIETTTVDDSRFDSFENLSKQLNAYIYFGSVPLAIEGRVFNSALLFTPTGERLTPYQKIHLFDIHLSGHDPVRESDEFVPGTRPSVIDIKGWKWGLSICYDLRFAELFSKYSKLKVDVISVPSAFMVPTGEAHWHTLLRARAIEAQAFVVAPAQAGSHKGLRDTFGHSLVVDPWGGVLLEMKENGTRVVELERSAIERVRKQIPMSDHRRLD